MRGGRRTAKCNDPNAARREDPVSAWGRAGTRDARSLAQMKDIVLIGVSVAFFALSWLYARSFDGL